MHTSERDEKKSDSATSLRGLRRQRPSWSRTTLVLWLAAFLLVGTGLGVGVRASGGKRSSLWASIVNFASPQRLARQEGKSTRDPQKEPRILSASKVKTTSPGSLIRNESASGSQVLVRTIAYENS